MYQNTDLENALKYSHTVDSNQVVLAEWNLNASYNISRVGNYRYRLGSTDPLYSIIAPTYDPNDAANNYTGATDSDIIINAGFDDTDTPAYLISPKKKINLIYSLDDCFKHHRPRSGINKILYLGSNQYIDGLTSGISPSVNVSRRPRYYMASRYDDFKYWTSYRTQTEDNITQEYGVSLREGTGSSYYIYDAAPFVIYNDPVPANRVVVKMQTNVGETDNGPFRMGGNTNFPDPLYGLGNRTVPRRWAIQGLDNDNNWFELKSFTENETRSNGDPIISSDGIVEIEYGLSIPQGYENNFLLVDYVTTTSAIPELAPNGYAYIYKESETDRGVLYVSDGSNWITYTPEYGWILSETEVTRNTKVVRSLTNPDNYVYNGSKVYRELQFLKGLRVVVDTMNKSGCTFDLIELSPRLVSDISDKIISLNVNKVLSDLGTNSMPTGNLLASTGSLEMFDEGFAFNSNNSFDFNAGTGSVISNFVDMQIKFMLYDVVRNIGNYDYYIPLKTLYSERVPQTSDSMGTISFELRDLFFLLESKKSPEMLITNVSLSYAVTLLLDSIGFSNYTFKRLSNENDLIIPFFFIGPDQSVAETLQQLAISSQSAMYFDEYNNLVVMSKNYILPSNNERSVDLTLYGQEYNDGSGTVLPNIINLSSQEKNVYNGGEITYTTRYIQKSIGSIAQAPYTDEYKQYIYKPVLLWEVAGQEMTKTINDVVSQSSGYSLAAIPLKTDLTDAVPSYSGGEILNNILDFGEGVYWLGNYSGYFYANGEIIRYDAVEYSVAGVGNVWITNNQQYQEYFSRLRFNGKIYPTGRVRIYTNVQDGVMKEHGRGQFGTDPVYHTAGFSADSTWVSDDNVRGSIQNAKDYLFNTNAKILYPTDLGIEKAGEKKDINGEPYLAQAYAIKSTRNGIIKNFLANTGLTELETNYYKSALSGSVQSSALVFNGPSVPSAIDPADFVTYVYKNLDKPYRTFGTRMRIIGKVESGTNTDQQPTGLFSIYSADLASTDPSKQVSLSGGGGGLAFGLNKDTNIGYYFEIDALSQNSISSYKSSANTVSYTIVKSPVVQVSSNVVTVTLETQHDFEVGDKVLISSVVDDNRKTSPTAINGEYSVTAISSDRKQFQYNITPITTSSSVSAASSDGTVITYISSGHNFVAGNIVTITGFTTTAYNITGVVSSVGTNSSGVKTFVISTAITAGSATGTGTATYQNLTTIASTGGVVSRNVDENTLISNVFLYKVKSGYNDADIAKKSLTSNVATLTTIKDHSFSVGEEIVITGVDATFNGTYQITAIPSPRKFSYAKTASDVTETDLTTLGLARSTNRLAIPEILWRGFAEIIVDDGKFTGQSRLVATEKPTVYDMSVEYIDIGTTKKFYLYLNDKQIATVTDLDPLPSYNNMALFVRGSSRCMFEHVYALSDNFANNNARALQLPVSQAFTGDSITESEALSKYAISGIVQNTYLTGISSQGTPEYSMYYDEFGTIMREAAYFNVKYDRAYPALYAALAKTVNRSKGYTTSGFYAGSYGAEFLIFNAIDKNLNLDDTSGNYLRILGIAFTQNTTNSLKVEDFFKKNSSFINSYYDGTNDSQEYQQLYQDLLNSRNRYGVREFTIQAEYIQTDAAAEEAMDWIIKKVMYPRLTVGLNTFATPHLQLGDIVSIDYQDPMNGVDVVSLPSKKFVVYNIQYQKSNGQFSTTVHLAEV